MLGTYQNADQTERRAIIKQIDSFLPVTKGDEKSFWLNSGRNSKDWMKNKAKWKYLVGIKVGIRKEAF